MHVKLENVLPSQIETRSFEIIASELEQPLDPQEAPVTMRCIHTSADFDYAHTLKFSPGVLERIESAIEAGCTFVTDTNMGKSGINKAALKRHGCEVACFMGDEDIALSAKAAGTTRAVASMNKASKIDGPVIFAIGNAPTALVRLYELIQEGIIAPVAIIGVPVGFVNVVQSKELIMSSGVPYIVNEGRKGGSNIAAAICNALLYSKGRD